jgi:hypothetical protein
LAHGFRGRSLRDPTEGGLRGAGKLIGAAGAACAALVLLASVHSGLVDSGADVVLVVSLLALSRAVFLLVDEEESRSARGWRRRKPPPG